MSDDPTIPEPETEDILLVYCGQRIGEKDRPYHYWYAVTPAQFEEGVLPDDLYGDTFRSYDGKLAKKHLTGGVGSVYRVPQKQGSTTIYPGDARYQGLWPDDEQRLKWQTEHRTAITAIDLKKKQSKEGAEDNFAALRPIRRQYARLISQNQRAALLAQIIAFITGGE